MLTSVSEAKNLCVGDTVYKYLFGGIDLCIPCIVTLCGETQVHLDGGDKVFEVKRPDVTAFYTDFRDEHYAVFVDGIVISRFDPQNQPAILPNAGQFDDLIDLLDLV